MTKTARHGVITMLSLIAPAVLWFAVATLSHKPSHEGNEASLALQITTSIENEKANRKNILTAFFKKYKSPLLPHVDAFVDASYKYKIDYRLLPAIACNESSCGKFLIPDSYNPFGWGIYGNNVIKFASYDEAIEKVGHGLYKGYLAKGLDTPEEIEPIYTPPSKGRWRKAVRFFMNQMDVIAEGELVASK